MAKIETVHVNSHLKHYLESVYDPAEDTFLLIDSIEKDLPFIKSIGPSICLEVGCGSGTVISSVARVFQGELFCIATDINPSATELTKALAESNKVYVETLVADLTSPLQARLLHLVDLLIFNPPYVVTPSEEVAVGGLRASWAGGLKGRQVIDRFLPSVANLLSAKGLFYLVTIHENDPDQIITVMRKYNLHGKAVLSRQCGREFLTILRFSHSVPP